MKYSTELALAHTYSSLGNTPSLAQIAELSFNNTANKMWMGVAQCLEYLTANQEVTGSNSLSTVRRIG